ncbi:MAG: Ppx/GppA family phosphatase, partial [Cyanobacteria bacterium J06628_6]
MPIGASATSLLPKRSLDRRTSLGSGRDHTLAAIDIGTNSIHMVVVKIEPDLPTFRIIAKQKDTVRLGNFCPKTKGLSEEAITRAIDSLKRCMQIARSLQAQDVVAVATSATREATNGQAFIDRVQAEVGLTINVIS